MPRNTQRWIASLTLAAFLVVDGSAIARTLPRQRTCQICHQLAACNAGAIFQRGGIPGCECCARESQPTSLPGRSLVALEKAVRPTCPCPYHESPGDSCPCPGGCAYCCVGKIPCVTPVSTLLISALPESWDWWEASNCYSSPFCGR